MLINDGFYIFKSKEIKNTWVAQWLEYDMSTQDTSPVGALQQLLRMIKIKKQIDIQNNVIPFSQLSKPFLSQIGKQRRI